MKFQVSSRTGKRLFTVEYAHAGGRYATVVSAWTRSAALRNFRRGDGYGLKVIRCFAAEEVSSGGPLTLALSPFDGARGRALAAAS